MNFGKLGIIFCTLFGLGVAPWARADALPVSTANDGREDYVRARLVATDAGPVATPLPVQDSSMLAALAQANCLLVRPANAPAAKAGARCRIIRLP